MSASPQRFNLVPQTTRPEVTPSPEQQPQGSELLVQIEEMVRDARRWQLYSLSGILLTFVAGVLCGYFLYLLWEQVNLHDSQIARQQVAIQKLEANGAALSTQAGRVDALGSSVGSVQALLEVQSRRLAELEKGQTGLRDQMTGMNTRWQREVRELGKTKPTVPNSSPATAPAATAGNMAVPASNAPSTPVPAASAEKHNETFSPDLKPSSTAYAQMSPNGLVIWMTPRPGFAKPVPTSVIGHVRGLEMLVHDWNDNNHYFITESGSWILDQR